MKKILAVILALCLVAALFAGCGTQTKDKENDPTQAPEVTAEPSEPTAEPEATPEANTPEPTEEPEPTPVPFNDPYAVEILDWLDADGFNASFDSILINKQKVAEGDVSLWKSENDETVDGTGGTIKTISMRGWNGFNDLKQKEFGYQIDGNPVVWVKRATEATEPEVKAVGGDYAQRFNVTIPVENLFGEGHEITLVTRLEDGSVVYLNKEEALFMLYYNGPEAPETAIDGTIGKGEYNAQYSLNKKTAKTWTGSEIGDTAIEYYVSLKEDGLYLAIDATGVAAGDMLQLNFNPGARIDDSTGLFVSFVVGEELKVLQHNHTNKYVTEVNQSGNDITASINAKIVAKEGGYVVEAMIPADFFGVTDVEKADEFNYGRENLYFGMFAVLGANGYTNQSTAPGTDWTCKGLALHEYIAY
ncbi:MAG: hypothetical protein K6B54_05270 [Clostridia bacterium]|nr:hypothetical protein [Clostridia bacterium]